MLGRRRPQIRARWDADNRFGDWTGDMLWKDPQHNVISHEDAQSSIDISSHFIYTRRLASRGHLQALAAKYVIHAEGQHNLG